MSMFRRPTDDSSDSESSSDESESDQPNQIDHRLGLDVDNSNASTEDEVIGTDLTTAGTHSSGESISVQHSRADTSVGDIDHVRSLMLASLLEDFYRTRAAEVLTAANPGKKFDRRSPEVQPLAQSLFTQAGQALSSNGLLPATVVSDNNQRVREQYLDGFDRFGLQNIKGRDQVFNDDQKWMGPLSDSLALVKPTPSIPALTTTASSHPMHDLAYRTENLSIVPHPGTDMRVASAGPSRSHYRSSFQEVRLLGRGGFGRVYQTYNIFDKREYAVKKIPLSAKLSKQYRERGHTELTSILREVQALAQLDHCNVVRYHATWIEDPVTMPKSSELALFELPFQQRRLLARQPVHSSNLEHHRNHSTKYLSFETGSGIVFEADSVDQHVQRNPGLEWSHHSNAHIAESSTPDSDIFTDGRSCSTHPTKSLDDPSCYVLHVQMSIYPLTLAQYLSTPPMHTTTSTIKRRHCFHLIPAIRILLGILCGLQYIHAQGLVHRDIKPSNIFLSNYEPGKYMPSTDGFCDVGACPLCPDLQSFHVNPRIGDFGLVTDIAHDNQDFGRTSGSLGSVFGTEYYRPPTGTGKTSTSVMDERVDIYALGVILVELLWLCGTSMERMNLLKRTQKGIAPQEVTSAIEFEGYFTGAGNMVKECIEGMIERDHTARWTSAKVKQHLEDVLARCHDQKKPA